MKKWRVNWRSCLLGTAIGLLAMVCITAAAAAVMGNGTVDVETMPWWAAGILLAMGLTGGLTALLGGGSPADAALTAVGELVVLFGLNGVLCGGKMEGIWVTMLALGGGCGAAVLLRLGQGRGTRRRRGSRRKS